MTQSISNDIHDVKAPKYKSTADGKSIELPCKFEDVSDKGIKAGCKHFIDFESGNMDMYTGYATTKQTSLKWYRYVKKVVWYHLDVRRKVRSKSARALYRIPESDLSMPNAALKEIDAGPLGAAFRKSLPSFDQNSPLRLWKIDRQGVLTDAEASMEADSTIALFFFATIPLFDPGKMHDITDLLTESSWCNPVNKISGTWDRLRNFQQDLKYRRELWPVEPYPSVLDMRAILINFRVILKESHDSDCMLVYKALVEKEHESCISACLEPEVLVKHLDFMIQMYNTLRSCNEKCFITDEMKRTRTHNVLAEGAGKGAGKGGKNGTNSRARDGKAAKAADGKSASATPAIDFEHKIALNESLSKLQCPAFGAAKEDGLCSLAGFCVLSHQQGKNEKCVCGRLLKFCQPSKHRQVTKQEGKKFTVFVEGRKEQREFLHGGLREKPPPMTEAQKALAKKRDELLISKGAFHALPQSHPKSTRYESWKSSKQDKGGKSGKGSRKGKGDDSNGAVEKSAKAQKRAEARAKKAQHIKDCEAVAAGTADAATAARVKAALEAKVKKAKGDEAAPAQPQRPGLPPGMRRCTEADEATGTMKAAKATHERMLSDSGCFKCAGPRGCTQQQPNAAARVQPIDGPPITIEARQEVGGEKLLYLGDELVSSENRVVERQLDNGLHFIVNRTRNGTEYIEMDALGEERIRDCREREARRCGGRIIELERTKGCDYVVGEDVSYVWRKLKLPALKSGVEAEPEPVDMPTSSPETPPSKRARDEANLPMNHLYCGGPIAESTEEVRGTMINHHGMVNQYIKMDDELPFLEPELRRELLRHEADFAKACQSVDELYQQHKHMFDALAHQSLQSARTRLAARISNESRRRRVTDVSVELEGNEELSPTGTSAGWALPLSLFIILATIVRGEAPDTAVIHQIGGAVTAHPDEQQSVQHSGSGGGHSREKDSRREELGGSEEEAAFGAVSNEGLCSAAQPAFSIDAIKNEKMDRSVQTQSISIFEKKTFERKMAAKQPPEKKKTDGHTKMSKRVDIENGTTVCCCCGKKNHHVYMKCECVACPHFMCGSCWANQGGSCPKSHHTKLFGGRPLGLSCICDDIEADNTQAARAPGTGEPVFSHAHSGLPQHAGAIRHAHQCSNCHNIFRHKHIISTEEKSISMYGRGPDGRGHYCRGCELEQKASSSLPAIENETKIAYMAAAARNLAEPESSVWTRRWRCFAAQTPPSGSEHVADSFSWEVMAVHDKDFDYCYHSEVDRQRLTALLQQVQPFQLEVCALWRSCLQKSTSIYDTVKMFEYILAFHTVGDTAQDTDFICGMKAGSKATQTRKKPTKQRLRTYDSCLLHVGYDHRCELCRMVMQKILGKHAGTTSLSRGFWIGHLVLYGDLKTSMPRSMRGNTILFVIVAYFEAQWNVEKQHWVYTGKIRIGIPLRRKDERNILYGLRVALTELRVTARDKWYIHFDNEPAMLSQAVLAAMSVMGGDLVNSLPNLHDSTAEGNVNATVREGSVELRKSNLGPLGWDCVMESTMYWNAEDEVKLTTQDKNGAEQKSPWKRFYNRVPRFPPGIRAATKLPSEVSGRQDLPVGGQWTALLGFARRTSDGVWCLYRDDCDAFHLTVVAYDSCVLSDPPELAFPPGSNPVALKEPWPDLAKEKVDTNAYIPFWVPCEACGVWRSVPKATYDDWSNNRIEAICHEYFKNQALPERWSCYEPVEDDEDLDWRQPTAAHQACNRIVLAPESEVRKPSALAAPADADADSVNDAHDDIASPQVIVVPRADEGLDSPAPVEAPVADDTVDEALPSSANVFDGYNPQHISIDLWTPGDFAKLADLKARRYHNSASDLRLWWRRMPAKEFAKVYESTEAKRMSSCVSEPLGAHRLTAAYDAFKTDCSGLCHACLDEDFSTDIDSGRVHAENCGRHHGGFDIPVQHLYTCPTCYSKCSDSERVDMSFEEELQNAKTINLADGEGDMRAGTGTERPAAPAYVPFDLTVFDSAVDGTMAAGSASDMDDGDDVDLDVVLNDISKDLQNFDGLDDIQRGCIQTDLNSAKVKAMTKAQRLRWKRQNRTLARKVAQFRQNVGERNTLLQAEDPKDRIVFEIDDLDGSLKRIEEIIATLGYLPPSGRCNEEEARLLEEGGMKVTKTVTLNDLKGREDEVQQARDLEASVIRDFEVLGMPYADNAELRSLPGFNWAPIIGAYALKWFSTPDETVRARAVYNGAISKLGDNARAIYETIKDIPASLMEIRLVIVITRLMGWVLRQADVVGAYLNSNAPKNSFVKLPREWACLLNETARKKFFEFLDAGIPCLIELKKALYGHVLAGALWAKWFAEKLIELGWVQVKDCSSSLWFLYNPAKELVAILAIYVDDFIIGASQKIIDWFDKEISKFVSLKKEKGHTTGLHQIDKLIGGTYISRLWYENDVEHEDVFIDVGSYAQLIADRFFNSETCRKSEYAKPGRFTTPMDTTSFAAPAGVHPEGIFKDDVPTHTGGGLWCQRLGMANLCASTCALARETHAWTTNGDRALHRYMSFLSRVGSKIGLLLSIVALAGEEVIILGQSDADHGSNARTRISISGFHVYIVTCRGTFCLIEWCSARQRAIALSTAEAELAALQLLLKCILNICMILRLCGIFPRVILCVDSVSAIAVAQSGISTKLRYSSVTQGLSAAWVQEVCKLLATEPTKIDTVLNSCDIQTKGLPLGPFRLHSLFMGLIEKQVWLDTVRCRGVHLSPLGEIRCKARAAPHEPFLCGVCASHALLCPCWYGVSSFDERYRTIKAITP